MITTHSLELRKIRNIETGEEIVIDTRETRYKRICLGFLNKLKLETKFLKHIILTQKEENYKPSILNYFLTKMRKYYKNSIYIWTVEDQERGVLHWHILFGFDWDIEFGKEDVQRIQRFWKYGIVEIVPVKKPNMRYLTKYITKALSAKDPAMRGIRRIGTSRIEGWLKQGWRRVCEAMDFFINTGYFHMDDFYWRNGRAYADLSDSHGKVLIYAPRRRWEIIDHVSAEWVDNLF